MPLAAWMPLKGLASAPTLSAAGLRIVDIEPSTLDEARALAAKTVNEDETLRAGAALVATDTTVEGAEHRLQRYLAVMLLVKDHPWARWVVLTGPDGPSPPTSSLSISGERLWSGSPPWIQEDFAKADRLFTALWPFIREYRHEHLPPPDQRRLARSLNWWHVAHTNPEGTLRIPIVVTAIEALLSVDTHDNTRKFARRLAALLAVPGDAQRLYDQAKVTYTVRSKLLHGEPFADFESVIPGTSEAVFGWYRRLIDVLAVNGRLGDVNDHMACKVFVASLDKDIAGLVKP